MAKYDKFFNSQKTIKEELTPEDAVTAIAVVTAAAESSLDEVDADTIADLLWDFEFFEDLSEDDLYDTVDRLLATADESGVGALFNSAKALLTGDLLLDAFASGVLMLVDEDELIIPKGRQALLKKLQEALGIEDSDAQEVIDEVIEAFNEAETLDFEAEEEEEGHQN